MLYAGLLDLESESSIDAGSTCSASSEEIKASGRRVSEARADIEPITLSISSRVSNLVSGQKKYTVIYKVVSQAHNVQRVVTDLQR